VHHDLSDLLGYVAAGLVLVTFSVRSMTALRSVAIASNVMFIAYAVAAQLMPVLILHALLLPLNIWRLRQT
jgi:CRP/FNR family cyclic AMP-dependent transcriptional regulator